MGIDFNNLIKNLGQTAASLQNDKAKIDTKTELNTYVSGWDAIKAKAEAENATSANQVDVSALEGDMKSELASLMGADFGKSAGVENKGTSQEPVFSDEEISLENMMALLAPEDGLDIDKLREQNKKPMLSTQEETSAVSDMNEFGFDAELTDILMESTPGAVKYISDAIKSGSASRISDNTHAFEKDIEGAKRVMDAMKELLKADIKSMTTQFQNPKPASKTQLENIKKAYADRMANLSEQFERANSEMERTRIGNEMILEELQFTEETQGLE